MASNGSNENGTSTEPETYKQQLDRVATERRNAEQPQQIHPVVEKIIEFIPPAAPLLGVKQDDKDKKEPEQPSGPPERPSHDPSIAEFVRDQHRSNGEDGLLAGKE